MSKLRTVTTHIAGPAICLSGRVIQRCVVCGEKLCDSLGVMVPSEPDEPPAMFPTWQEGAFVEQEGNRTSITGNICNGDKVPDSICLDLVE